MRIERESEVHRVGPSVAPEAALDEQAVAATRRALMLMSVRLAAHARDRMLIIASSFSFAIGHSCQSCVKER
jgi:hypothetical protein